MDCSFAGQWVTRANQLKSQQKLKLHKSVELWLDAECGAEVQLEWGAVSKRDQAFIKNTSCPNKAF
tara:strand:+ start:354 stop:551 length:198 start_codon:yes stop_codon:yes gene_type:complete